MAMEGLGFLQPGYSNRDSKVDGGGVSADGSVVAGQSPTTSPTIAIKPFRWEDGSGPMQLIPDLPGGSYAGFARDVDDSGNVVIGRQSSTNGSEAFRWTSSGGIEGLGDLPGDRFFSEGHGVSGDGNVVVGYSESSNGNESFRWTASGGMVGLGDLAGGTFNGRGEDANYDGSVVVGWSVSSNGTEAYRWTDSGGMVGLGDLAGGGFASAAYSTSADGSIVVGLGTTAVGNEGFIWDSTNGMQRFQDYLSDNGISTTGWTLTSVEAVSADGLSFAGRGTNPDGDSEGWYAQVQSVPEPGFVAFLP